MSQLKKRSEFDFRNGQEMSLPVKLEIEDERRPLTKRFKSSLPLSNQFSTEIAEFPVPPTQYNPLDEPSPLGLRLRKSPSLLDLIQMTLSQGKDSSHTNETSGDHSLVTKKDFKAGNSSGAFDKLKASNFPASLLKIGKWEYISKHEGDLVAKCYFAKHKLVWEVLDGGLKSKIEIQWSDIMGLKANITDDGPSTLTVILARQPLFFRETNPQPRKHTLWQAAADFTDGQASLHRQHVLQCPQGLLNKHYEKLIQCDVRLNCLSQQPEILLDSPYFLQKDYVSEEDPNELSRTVKFNTAKISSSSSSPISSTLYDVGSPSISSVRSPSSVMDTHAIEGNLTSEGNSVRVNKNPDSFQPPGIRPSMSMNDLVNHIFPDNLNFPEKQTECRAMLENIAQILLSDTQTNTASDEKILMSRVNSLCYLLQDPPTSGDRSGDRKYSKNSAPCDPTHEKTLMARVNSLRCLLQDHPTDAVEGATGDGKKDTECDPVLEKSLMARVNSLQCLLKDPAGAGEVGGSSGNGKETMVDKEEEGTKMGPGMKRIDSFGELLSHLPRIASLPKFLFDISEDGEIL
jgi:hypothetical protein